jgi:tetratricopeptide (TPR) repeat protein
VVLGEIRAFNDWDWNGARGEFERALAIDSADTDALRGMAMMVLAPEGRIKDAIGEMNRVVDLDPLDADAGTQLGILLYLDQQSDAAIAQWKKTDSAEARAILSRIDSQPHADAPAFWQASAYANAGDQARAIAQLDRAYDQHDPMLAYVRTWPAFKEIRPTAGFQSLLKKMNLTR